MERREANGPRENMSNEKQGGSVRVQYTSFELSKKLWENGCRVETNISWFNNLKVEQCHFVHARVSLAHCGKNNITQTETFPAFDLLWEICVKYSKEFFGDKKETSPLTCENILYKLRTNTPIKEIEKYIWHYCLFNPKNVCKFLEEVED